MGKIAVIPTNAEYTRLYATMEIHSDILPQVNYLIDQKILPNKQRYVNVRNQLLSINQYEKRLICFVNGEPPVDKTIQSKQSASWHYYYTADTAAQNKGIPWFVIALIHYLECNFNFNQHLYNGDPLSDYTHRAPAGEPHVGHKPPFTFEESAVASLKREGFHAINQWTLPVILKTLEQYNGFGYEKMHLHTPYLWGGSNHYQQGKFVEHKLNGKWKSIFEPQTVSKQIGAAVILRTMELRGVITVCH